MNINTKIIALRKRDRNIPHRRMSRLGGCLAALCLLGAGAVQAQSQTYAPTAFTSCPSKAFLTQGTVAQTYGVNLVTGDYTVLAQDHGTSRSLNAVGFNGNDRFIYAWSREHGQPVRVHNDWQIEVLGDINISNNNFYIGDVDVDRNIYYVYRPGSSYGLYAIGLEPSRDDYLKMSRIVDGKTLSFRSADFAVSPIDGYIYAVESNGTLHRINQEDGSSLALGNSGQTGTFGAAYFDADGNLYIGRNKDGKVFRIAVTAGEVNAELFASGPASNTNDGSRCAAAPIIDDDDINIDFGDAPDTYLTSLESNGARHGLLSNPGLFLGEGADGEANAYIYPLTDDETGTLNDDDGVQMIVEAVEREYAIASVKASGEGYLNVWIDVHQDGRFDAIDHVGVDYFLEEGQQAVYLPIPDGVQAGTTWARFRFSSSNGLEPYGGAPDGEVEDMRVRVHKNEITITDYPSASGWTTIAFEDNWPLLGDYDMNDLAVYLRTTTYRKSAGFTKIEIAGELAGAGASYHNGFGIRLPGVARSNVDEKSLIFKINGRRVATENPLEADRKEAILIITKDVFDHIGPGNHCEYYRTEPDCGSDIQMKFELSVEFIDPVDVDLSGVFDPFLFATEGEWHGAHFVEPPGRAYEIHLKNQSPTEAFNPALFNRLGNDVSNPDAGEYFLSATGMPWAIEVADRWQYPQEYKDMSKAYPKFKEFSNSGGKQSVYWYDSGEADKDLLFSE